jgi:hypothetical protein
MSHGINSGTHVTAKTIPLSHLVVPRKYYFALIHRSKEIASPELAEILALSLYT